MLNTHYFLNKSVTEKNELEIVIYVSCIKIMTPMILERLNYHVTLTRFIIAIVFLRSLIATGCMLSVSGVSLEIIICDGPVSFKPTISEGSGHEHHHLQEHSEKSQLHISPICSDWSTSSLQVFNTFFELSVSNLLTFGIVRFIIFFFDKSFDSINQIRAPPPFLSFN